MKLSCRLETIASFVRNGSKIADVGTDHGYIPIYLVQKDIASFALAMDVRTGPLERAKSHIEEYGLEDRISLRISDGLTKLLPDEADTVIIAGMGGGLMIHIIEEGRHVWDTVEHWVLSPQSDIGDVRRFLARNGFLIEREAMVKEDDKYYTVIEAVRGSMSYEKEGDYRYGKYLIDEKNPILKEYLEKERITILSIIFSLKDQNTESARKRTAQLWAELALMEDTYRVISRH